MKFLLNLAFLDAATPWQLGFQDPATPIIIGIIQFHNHLIFFLVVIGTFVFWLLYRALVLFKEDPYITASSFTHNTALEVVWTITPALVLLVLILIGPSLALCDFSDEAFINDESVLEEAVLEETVLEEAVLEEAVLEESSMEDHPSVPVNLEARDEQYEQCVLYYLTKNMMDVEDCNNIKHFMEAYKKAVITCCILQEQNITDEVKEGESLS